MTMPYASGSQINPDRCNWCEGSGVMHYAWAYVPGSDPFAFSDTVTAHRVGTCRYCRGTGIYDASSDPRLAQARRR